MVDVSDAELDRADKRGAEMLKMEPRAIAVHYDAATGRVVIDLVSGCLYAFPAALVQDLQGVDQKALAGVLVDGAGFNLHWPDLDVDLYVPALLRGTFGTRAWMTREFARVAGGTTSVAKSAAARANGAKGGRPRKAAVA